ncbi:MAG TPA: hypothetical protein VKX25_07740 [Bryobacteraceae bacterium]|jgi:hypothetical protein|nr:hypothetical protein [Bryobacteraceae bacterium]
MRYYIYISDAKIDMLWPQVPHAVKKKVANEFKIDLKAFSASRKVETEAEDSRIARPEAGPNPKKKRGKVSEPKKSGHSGR